MNAHDFIQDLAVIMLVAGVITIIFNRFKQPVVLGYILAGIILGPHTPPFNLISSEETISTLAELGIVFLLFSLGLEFSIKKLVKVGPTALIAALAEIILMTLIGYGIGQFFGWEQMDSLFLGAILAISSTTIIVKALDELGLKREKFAQLIFGILIVEDILAIGIIALLSTLVTTGGVTAGTIFSTLGKLSLFMVVSLVLGILIVPRVLSYVAKFKSNEMLLVTVLGLCFGFCLLVMNMGYSIALGAFVIGAIMAESKEFKLIERITEPLKDMFSAIFFVAIGLLLNPAVLVTYAFPIIVITLAVVLGKIISCSLGTFAAGNTGKTSLQVGMGLAQIGEFSFIIATLGLTLNVTSDFLYPIAVAVSAITTLLTPYLIRLANPLSDKLTKSVPQKVAKPFKGYKQWLKKIKPEGRHAEILKVIRRILIQIGINFALVAAVFLTAAYLGSYLAQTYAITFLAVEMQNTLIWGLALIISLPFIIVAYQKLHVLSILFAELIVKSERVHIYRSKKLITEIIPIVFVIVILFTISAASFTIFPPLELLLIVLAIAGLVAFVLWKWFIRLHSKLQMSFMETINTP